MKDINLGAARPTLLIGLVGLGAGSECGTPVLGAHDAPDAPEVSGRWKGPSAKTAREHSEPEALTFLICAVISSPRNPSLGVKRHGPQKDSEKHNSVSAASDCRIPTPAPCSCALNPTNPEP